LPGEQVAEVAGVSPTAVELVAMEYRFSQWARYRGIREAFLAHLSGDAILFKPTGRRVVVDLVIPIPPDHTAGS
jgi:hypothetical protein